MRRFIPLLLLFAGVIARAEDAALIGPGEFWRYARNETGQPPHPRWHEKSFDDEQWAWGRSGYVLPEDEPGVIRPASATPHRAFIRKRFEVKDVNAIHSLVLRVEHEKGFVARLNGVEIARHHGEGVHFPTEMEKAMGMEDPEVTPAEIDVSQFISLLSTGDNLLAIEAASSGESVSAFTASASLVINFPRGPFLAKMTTNSVTIVWRTGPSAAGSTFVEYGETDALGLLYTNGATVWEHLAMLTDLKPDSTYYYRVGTLIRGTQRAVSSISTFKTAKMSGSVRFAVFGDSGQASTAQSQIAGVLRNARPDLVLHCGDIVYGGFNDGTVDTRFFSYYSQHLRTTPYYLTAGNHDIGCCSGEQPDWNQPTWELRATNFQSAFYLPTNNVTGTEHFYSFDYGDVHFVSLYNPWFFNYNFPSGIEQLTWLTNDLAASSKPWKLIFMHMPVADSGLHGGTDADGNGLSDQSEMINLLHPIAAKYGVQLVFGGHDHNFERFAPTNGLHHCVNGGGGGGIYQMTGRHMASAQFWPNNNCTLVSIAGDTLTLEVLDVFGEIFDSMVIHRATTTDFVYQSTWNTPVIETDSANDGDGNIMGQTFDLKGQPLLTKAGKFSNLGWVYVNNDSTNLYIGIKSAMFYGNNNVFLFVETPRQTGVSDLIGLGNGIVDPAGQGVDGLDFLENLTFVDFKPSIACVLGDEFADGQFRNFARTGLFSTGQGVFRLDSAFSDIAGSRVQQFNRSPQLGPVADDANADLMEVAIPLAELGYPGAGEMLKIAAVVAGSSVDPVAQTRELDSSALATVASLDATGKMTLTGVRVRLAALPEIDTDGDGLLDNWEYRYALNPNSDVGDDGADGDPDHDGETNAQEQLTGTNPRDPNSVFRLTLTRLPASRYLVKWRTIPGLRYQLEYADDLTGGFTPATGAVWPRVALTDEDTYLDNTSTNQNSLQRSYRVRLTP